MKRTAEDKAIQRSREEESTDNKTTEGRADNRRVELVKP